MNTVDADVPRYLRAFTLMEIDEIEEIVAQHSEKPELRYGQQRLASYLTEMIFGKASVQQAEKISEILFGSSDKLELVTSMNAEELQALAYETGSVTLAEDETRIVELIVQSALAPSNGEAKKLIQSGSIFFNEQKVEDLGYVVKKSDLINGAGLLRKGKKTYKTIVGEF
jgi:tyrosyl-tRNA synthetase